MSQYATEDEQLLGLEYDEVTEVPGKPDQTGPQDEGFEDE